MNLNPANISATADLITAIVAVCTAGFLFLQLRGLHATMHAAAFKSAYDILQTEFMREARGFVLSELKDKPFASWTPAEKKRAEPVCQSYDSVGIMCRHGFVPIPAIADSWGDSLRRCWAILAPLVHEYRVTRNSKEYWDDFEWLAGQASKHKKRVHDENA